MEQTFLNGRPTSGKLLIHIINIHHYHKPNDFNRIPDTIGRILTTLGVTEVNDLEFVYDDEDGDILPQIKAACSGADFSKFQNARALTAVLPKVAPPPPPSNEEQLRELREKNERMRKQQEEQERLLREEREKTIQQAVRKRNDAILALHDK